MEETWPDPSRWPGAGVNGAGKTTQLQIITGDLEPDSGEVIKSRKNMKIAHLSQEFDVVPTRTVRCPTSQVATSAVDMGDQSGQRGWAGGIQGYDVLASSSNLRAPSARQWHTRTGQPSWRPMTGPLYIRLLREAGWSSTMRGTLWLRVVARRRTAACA